MKHVYIYIHFSLPFYHKITHSFIKHNDISTTYQTLSYVLTTLQRQRQKKFSAFIGLTCENAEDALPCTHLHAPTLMLGTENVLNACLQDVWKSDDLCGPSHSPRLFSIQPNIEELMVPVIFILRFASPPASCCGIRVESMMHPGHVSLFLSFWEKNIYLIPFQ